MNSETMWGIVGIGAGLIIQHVYFLLSQSRRQPCYAIRNTPVFDVPSGRVPGLSIKFTGYGPTIDSVNVAHLMFWNNGKTCIEKADVFEPVKIALMAADAVILDCELISSTHSSNQFAVQRNADRTAMTLSFKHIDYCDGCCVKVVHTSNHATPFQISGKIKEATLQAHPFGVSPAEKKQAVLRFVLAGLMLMLVASQYVVSMYSSEPKSMSVTSMMLLGMAIGITERTLLELWKRKRVPKHLRID